MFWNQRSVEIIKLKKNCTLLTLSVKKSHLTLCVLYVPKDFINLWKSVLRRFSLFSLPHLHFLQYANNAHSVRFYLMIYGAPICYYKLCAYRVIWTSSYFLYIVGDGLIDYNNANITIGRYTMKEWCEATRATVKEKVVVVLEMVKKYHCCPILGCNMFIIKHNCV